jgi:hypothetical protein
MHFKQRTVHTVGKGPETKGPSLEWYNPILCTLNVSRCILLIEVSIRKSKGAAGCRAVLAYN